MTDRLGLLAARPMLRGLDVEVLQEIDAALESVHVPGGTQFVHRGQTEVPLILVERGGLRASYTDPDGSRRVVFEYFRGSTIGEALVLSGRRSPLDLHAIRDSDLLYLRPDRFHAIALRHPQLALAVVGAFATHLLDLASGPEVLASFARNVDRQPRTIAVLTVGGPEVQRTTDLLLRALSRSRSTVRFGFEQAREALDGRSADVSYAALLEWLERLDTPAELVVLTCDPTNTSWLDFSLRQADRVMILVDGERRPPSERELSWWSDARIGARTAQAEVALVHAGSVDLPRSGGVYANLPGVARVHHVRRADVRDAERLTRWLLDRPVGLVLGGGGAYGFAHVGVVKALEEANVPVDIVGGTSMGAIFAGGIARGWSADRMMEEVRRLFASRFALYDPTLPVTALLAGKKLDRVLEEFFGDLGIVDLWIPFFCLATNISRARPHVHDAGELKGAIRSSCSIPGLFPPYRALKQILVDGGIVDNLPIDVMSERCRGPIIAVNVFPYPHQDEARAEDRPRARRRRRIDRLVENLLASTELGLSVFDILTRATFIGSQRTIERSLTSHPPALYLEPQLGGFRILDWRAHDAIFEIGYACTKRALERGDLADALH